MSLEDGSPTLLLPLVNRKRGESIAFNDRAGLLYHAEGTLLETIDPETLEVTIVNAATDYSRVTAIGYNGVGFFVADFSRIFRIDEDGHTQIQGFLDHTSKGIAGAFEDRDSDGLSDSAEALLRTRIDDPDTDGDGVNDGLEVDLGTDPRDPDSDDDGIDDGIEIRLGTDPNDAADFPTSVDVDIRPGSDSNKIDLENPGLFPVALITSVEFDATRVDRATLAFGPANATPAHPVGGHFSDVDGDGSTDLMTHFRVDATGITSDETEACLSGLTLEGEAFRGCDSVTLRMARPRQH